ncbi:gas vesicle protein GvpJ [Nonomuraea sp. NPDC048916]|uniref:gas vesicle protein GvpJ n=1 Tax=Nonomuraea sp. NPDC048916 TaxID=3154232 RepID=UPI0033D75F72
MQPANRGTAAGGGSATALADVIDTILDKGLVIDAFVRVSLVGIEVLTIDARIVVASVDTYLRFAEAVNRLDLSETGEKGLPELVKDVKQGRAVEQGKETVQGTLEAAGEKLEDLVAGTSTEREDKPRRAHRREEE